MPFTEIQEEVVIPAAHRLRATEGEGERLHGHNWRIRAVVRATALDARGMVLDFADLHAALVRVTERFRNRYLNEVAPFDDVNPTAENLAHHVADALEREIGSERVHVHRVQVAETDTCVATYYREG